MSKIKIKCKNVSTINCDKVKEMLTLILLCKEEYFLAGDLNYQLSVCCELYAVF